MAEKYSNTDKIRQNEAAALTDNDPMPYGKFKGIKMANLEDSYLVWLYDNGKCNAGVKRYIEENAQSLGIKIKR